MQCSSCARTSCGRPQDSSAHSPHGQEVHSNLCWALSSWEASATGVIVGAFQMGGPHLGRCAVCEHEPGVSIPLIYRHINCCKSLWYTACKLSMQITAARGLHAQLPIQHMQWQSAYIAKLVLWQHAIHCLAQNLCWVLLKLQLC